MHSAHRSRLPYLVSLIFLVALPTIRAEAAPDGVKTAAASQVHSVSLKTSDGWQLHALYWPGKADGLGAVLVHMASRSSEDWRRMGERLGNNGVHALALDLRGHGRSTTGADGKTLTYADLGPDDFQAMVRDVEAAVRYLRDQTNVDPERIVLIGASLGANLAIRYAAEDPRISNVILLSPGLEYKGVTAENAVEQYGSRPLFIAVSKEDRFSAKSALVLDALARGKKYLKIYTGAGHGTKMLSREPTLEPMIYKWMYGTFVDETSPIDDAAPPVRTSG